MSESATAIEKPEELLSLDEAIRQIKEVFDRPGLRGLKGFKVVAKTETSHLALEWGSVKMPRRFR